MTKNNNLYAAKAAKNDEFYTQLTDIENELSHYQTRRKTPTFRYGDIRHNKVQQNIP